MIHVAGEALVDLILDPAGALAPIPGGGPFNTARTVARLDRPVTFLGRLSADAFGRRLRGLLEEDGVALGIPAPTDAPTTLALAELDAAGRATYRLYVAGTSAPDLPPAALATAAPLGPADALHVGFLAWWTAGDHGREGLRDPALVERGVGAAVAVAAVTCERVDASPPRLSELRARGLWPD